MRNTLEGNVERVINNAGTGGKRFANVLLSRKYLSYVPEVYDFLF